MGLTQKWFFHRGEETLVVWLVTGGLQRVFFSAFGLGSPAGFLILCLIIKELASLAVYMEVL